MRVYTVLSRLRLTTIHSILSRRPVQHALHLATRTALRSLSWKWIPSLLYHNSHYAYFLSSLLAFTPLDIHDVTEQPAEPTAKCLDPQSRVTRPTPPRAGNSDAEANARERIYTHCTNHLSERRPVVVSRATHLLGCVADQKRMEVMQDVRLYALDLDDGGSENFVRIKRVAKTEDRPRCGSLPNGKAVW